MAGMKVSISNKLGRLGQRVAVNRTNALTAGAAMLQREIMAAAVGLDIWDTGNLINSHNRRKVIGDTWEVISPAEYSVFVHEGTKRAEARPWFESGIATAEPKIMAMLERAVLA